jgi:hypothetical protein
VLCLKPQWNNEDINISYGAYFQVYTPRQYVTSPTLLISIIVSDAMNVTMTDSSSTGKTTPFRKALEDILIDCIGSADQNLVSWQSVYFALVALAVNVMTQPCGRVCGQNPKMRTYLRSSPIFCGFDAFAIIIRILVYLVNRIAPFQAIQSTVAARFDNIDDELEGL